MKAREKRPRKVRAIKEVQAPTDSDVEEVASEETAASAEGAADEEAEAEASPAADAGDEAAEAAGEEAAEPAADTAGQPDDETLADDETPVPLESGVPPANTLDRPRMKAVLESLIFVSERTATAVQLARAAKLKVALARELLAELMQDYQGRGIELIEVAGGYQFRSAPACAEYVREFVAQKPVRLTSAQLETLALIAYRQPMTRPEIDDVRGVDSGSAVRVLLERNLIKMLGRKDEPGRPLLYGTSSYFLEFFGMRSLKDLPTLREFTDLSEESRALFKRKTGEAVDDAEAAFAESTSTSDEQVEHISDEDLAELAREADAEREADGDREATADREAAAPADYTVADNADETEAGPNLDEDHDEDRDLPASATEA
jgi:segregation and condensation protein B